MKFHAKQVLGVLKPRRRRRMPKRNPASSSSVDSPIQSLPDALISCIISRLGEAEDVATVSMVCRRWNACARYVNILRFDTGDEDVEDWAKQGSALGWLRIIHRSVALRKLCITSSGYPWDFNREMFILMCIVHACSELKILDLDLGLTIRSRFLDTVSKFKHLTGLHFANNSDIVEFLPGTAEFKTLKTCSLASFRMADESLEEFISQCPVLEELAVTDCLGLTKPRVVSDTLKALTFRGSEFGDWSDSEEYEEDPGVQILKIQAPKLSFLSIRYVHLVVCDGAQLRELEVKSPVEPRFKNLDKLETLRTGWACWPHDMLMRLIRVASNARHVVLSNFAYSDTVIPVAAEEVFGDLTRVESLEICGDYHKALVYSNNSANIRFSRLKKLCLWMTFSNEALIRFMLESSPVLEVLRLCISQLDTTRHTVSYLTSLLALRGAYPNVKFDLEVPP